MYFQKTCKGSFEDPKEWINLFFFEQNETFFFCFANLKVWFWWIEVGKQNFWWLFNLNNYQSNNHKDFMILFRLPKKTVHEFFFSWRNTYLLINFDYQTLECYCPEENTLLQTAISLKIKDKDTLWSLRSFPKLFPKTLTNFPKVC